MDEYDEATSRPGWPDGRRLHFERRLRHWTEEETARRCRRLGLYFGQPDPHLTAEVVTDWENGARLSPARLSLACLVLDVPLGDVLGLVDVFHLPEWTLLAAAVGGSIGGHQAMTRREFLRLLATTAMVDFDPSHLDAVLREAARVDGSLVNDLGAHTHQLAGQWGSMPTFLLHRLTLTHLEALKTILARPLGPGLRRDLMAVAARTAVLLGLVSCHLGHDDEARAHLALAGRLADGAGARGVEALSLVWTSDSVSGVQRGGDPAVDQRHVVELLVRAKRLAESAPSAVRAMTCLRLAEEVAGEDAVQAARLLDATDGAMEGPPDTDRTLYGLKLQPTLNICFRGNVTLLIGRPREAAAILTECLTYDLNEHNRAAVVCDLASAHVQLGDVDEACRLLAESWDRATRLGAQDRRRRVLGVRHRHLAAYTDVPAVKRLDDHLAVEVVRSESAP